MPASTAPGVSTILLPCTTERKACGRVSSCPMYVPHPEPAHEPSQSKQLGSSSAPTVTVPPNGAGVALVVGVPLLFADLPVLDELPHAASVSDRAVRAMSARGNDRAIRLTRHFCEGMKAVFRDLVRDGGIA